MSELQIILVDPCHPLCEAWEKRFGEFENVTVVPDIFENLKDVDCMVSAANSFGIMDGGVDLAISKYFGWDLQRRVQEHILEFFNGEQPVGTSFIIETKDERIPYVAHTPTMRVPLKISDTENVYLAMHALLSELKNFNRRSTAKITTVAIPGLGTATGQMDYAEASRQMYLAYKYYLNPCRKITWQYASMRQTLIHSRSS